MTCMRYARSSISRLCSSVEGMALVEFAVALPFLLSITLCGAEMTNYIIVRTRISQLALQMADNAARMGSGSPLQAKEITEGDVNDLFAGAQLQSRELNILTNGRVILSDLEPKQTPNTTPPKYKIGWQRCYGNKPATSRWKTGDTDLLGIGPANQLVTVAKDDGATMFVEITYTYKPIVNSRLAPSQLIYEFASMAVRDRRNVAAGVKPGGNVASCTT